MIKAIFLSLILLLVTFEASADQKTVEDVSYIKHSTLSEQQLDIYIPAPSHTKPFPVHIFVHGGVWTMGDKDTVNEDSAKAYTDNGIMVISLNYRLGPTHKYPKNIHDVLAATRWIKHNVERYGGDPNNIVLSGHSAGGHLVALAATYDTRNSAISHYKGVFPIDTAKFDLTKPSSGKMSRFVNKRVEKVFGTKKKTLAGASPLYRIRAGITPPPFFVFTSSKRPEVVDETDRFARKLKMHGYEVSVRIMDRVSHSGMKKEIFDKESPIFQSIVRALKK